MKDLIKGIIVLLVMVIFIVILSIYSPPPPQKTHIHYKVDAVFMHYPGVYSILYEENGEIKSLGGGNYNTNYKLVSDVPPGENMYADYFHTCNNIKDFLAIHIHSPKEINGGTYKVGKSDEQMTVPIEK